MIGRAFYDAEHAGKTPNRRENGKLTVWEIHPVMKLEVVGKDGQRGIRRAGRGERSAR